MRASLRGLSRSTQMAMPASPSRRAMNATASTSLACTRPGGAPSLSRGGRASGSMSGLRRPEPVFDVCAGDGHAFAETGKEQPGPGSDVTAETGLVDQLARQFGQQEQVLTGPEGPAVGRMLRLCRQDHERPLPCGISVGRTRTTMRTLRACALVLPPRPKAFSGPMPLRAEEDRSCS